MTTTVDSRNDFALVDLHPGVRADFERLIAATSIWHFTSNGEECSFRPFEGYRSPERQHYLLTIAKTTKARPWQSAHQYGMAVDFACFGVSDHRWTWPDAAPWNKLQALAARFGLEVPIRWDRGHVQHHMFEDLRKLW